MLRLSLLALLASVLIPLGLARADDGDAPEGKDGKLAIERVDLSSWAVPTRFVGPVLAAPSDLAGEGHATMWSLGTWSERGTPRPAWIEFDGTSDTGPLAFGVEALIEAVKSRGLPDERVALTADGSAVVIQGPAPLVAEARASMDWALALLAPSVRVRASLVAEGREAGLKAQGAVQCWAGRWTRLWLQEQRTVYVVDMDVEIAQGSTMSNPYEAELPEGQEAYVRWFPGEAGSLLEVWSGDLEHLDATEIDLSPARGAPEGSGHGTVRLPRTAVNRAYTALLLPPGGTATQEIAWQGLAGPRRLRLSVEGAPQDLAPVAHARNTQTQIAPLRLGAAAEALLFESRSGRIDRTIEELNALAGSMGQEGWVNGVPGGGGLAVAGGSRALLDAYRAHVKRNESALRAGTLRLRVLTVPEESVRAPFTQGTLAVGAALPEGLAERLRGAGSVEGEGIALPLLTGVKSGFRCGASVAGFMGFDVEVAQESGTSDPLCGARFHGLAGEAVLSNGPAGLHVRVEASVQWADAKASTLITTFRAPVGMDFNHDKVGPEPTDVRHPVFPLLGGGGGDVSGSWVVAPKDSGERLLGVVMRGGDALLVLGSFSAP